MSLLGPQLEAFLAVARCNTVQSAAKEVGLTQTGVTQRLRSLESLVKSTLFLRSRRGMQLTSEGEALLHYCQAVQDLEGETLARIQAAGTQKIVHVCISGPTSMMRARVIPKCDEILKTHANITFRFDFSDDGSGSEKLRKGFAHLVIIPREHVTLEMDSKIIKKQAYFLMGPRAWKERPLKEVLKNEQIIDFDPNDDATFRYLRHFKLLKLAKKERHFAANSDALTEMIGFGFGYSALPEFFAKRLIESKKGMDLNPNSIYYMDWALAWYPRPQMPAYFQTLVSSIH